MKLNIKGFSEEIIKGVKKTPKGLKAFLTSNRMKSLYWRTSMMCLSVIIGSLFSNLDLLAPYVGAVSITMLGLILGEVSKQINNSLGKKKLILPTEEV